MIIIRVGSGSACRSMYGGFVKWEMGANPDGSDSIAIQVFFLSFFLFLFFFIVLFYYSFYSFYLYFFLSLFITPFILFCFVLSFLFFLFLIIICRLPLRPTGPKCKSSSLWYVFNFISFIIFFIINNNNNNFNRWMTTERRPAALRECKEVLKHAISWRY